MPSVHGWAVDLAIKLIGKHGRTVQLVKPASADDTGWNMSDTNPTEVVAEARAVNTKYKAMEADGDLIRMTDRRYMMDSKFTPDTTMQIRDGGVDYEIKDVEPFEPGPDLIFHIVQARA